MQYGLSGGVISAEFFMGTGVLNTSEADIIRNAILDLRKSGIRVTNKSIILKILNLLECERDEESLQTFRNALEIVVTQTEDDVYI